MSHFTDRLEDDLSTIADRAAPSPTAWEAIQHKIAHKDTDPEMEIIMLSPDHKPDSTRHRTWWALAAAAAVLILVAGLVVANRSEDDSLATQPDPESSEPAATTESGVEEPDGSPTVNLEREIPNVLVGPRNEIRTLDGVLAGTNTSGFEAYDLATGEKLGSGPYGDFEFLPGAVLTLTMDGADAWQVVDLSTSEVSEALGTTSYPVAGSVDAVAMADGEVFDPATGEVVASLEEGWSPLPLDIGHAVLANEEARALRAVTLPDLEIIWEVDDFVSDTFYAGAIGDAESGVTLDVETGQVIPWVPDETRPDELCPEGSDAALLSRAYGGGFWAAVVNCGSAASNTLFVYDDADGSVIGSIDVGEVEQIHTDGTYITTDPTGDDNHVSVYVVS